MDTDLVQSLLLPGIILAFGKYLDYKMDKHKKEQDKIIQEQLNEIAKRQQREADRDSRINLLHEGLTAILRDRILQSTNYFINQGHITPLALENITKMHDVYKSMGGNGLCDRSYEEVNKLPVDKFTQA